MLDKIGRMNSRSARTDWWNFREKSRMLALGSVKY
jgi:hypothetical protein